MVNNQEILNLSNGTIADGITILLSANKTDGLSQRDVMMGEKKVGTIILARKDKQILENVDTNTEIINTDYEQKEVFAEGSTNGLM